jgi:RimJ/RimL family protein N-acetyltransferase
MKIMIGETKMDSRDITIRPIHPGDAEAFLDLRLTLDAETKFMLLEPGERRQTVESVRTTLESMFASDSGAIFVAEHDGRLIGYVSADQGQCQRNRHSAYIVTGIRLAYTGQGIGQRLFSVLEEWACSVNITRLELTVMTHNTRAIRLYERAGFEIEGTRRHALIIDGQSVDEYYMGKIWN